MKTRDSELESYKRSKLRLFVHLQFVRKVSLHAGGMGSMVIITLAMCMITGVNFNLLLFGIVLLAGIVGTCRIFLNAHDTYEVFTGYLIGMVGMMVAIEFY